MRIITLILVCLGIAWALNAKAMNVTHQSDGPVTLTGGQTSVMLKPLPKSEATTPDTLPMCFYSLDGNVLHCPGVDFRVVRTDQGALIEMPEGEKQ